MDLTNNLKQLGLGDYEALIYSTLLKNTPLGASNIAKSCGLARSSVYTTLNKLMSKGLVGITYKNEIKQFMAEDISTLEQILTNEKEKLAQKFKIIGETKKNLKRSPTSLNVPKNNFL